MTNCIDGHVWRYMNKKGQYGVYGIYCSNTGCEEQLYEHQVEAKLNAIERMNSELVMGDDEMQAYEWAIKQKFQSVAADYARTLAKYIKRIKLAHGGKKT